MAPKRSNLLWNSDRTVQTEKRKNSKTLGKAFLTFCHIQQQRGECIKAQCSDAIETGGWWTVGPSHQGWLLTCALERCIHHADGCWCFTRLCAHWKDNSYMSDLRQQKGELQSQFGAMAQENFFLGRQFYFTDKQVWKDVLQKHLLVKKIHKIF